MRISLYYLFATLGVAQKCYAPGQGVDIAKRVKGLVNKPFLDIKNLVIWSLFIFTKISAEIGLILIILLYNADGFEFESLSQHYFF